MIRGSRFRRRVVIEHRKRVLEANLDARLAARKTGRAERNARAKRSAVTRQHIAYAGDALINAMVAL